MKLKKRLLRERTRLEAEQKAAQVSAGKRPWLIMLSVVLIVILVFIAYGRSLSGTFIWDDEWLIKNNVYVTGQFNCKDIFTKDLGAGIGRQNSFYRPLQILLNKADFICWKLNPFGYHLTNILLHIFVCLSVYWLCRILFGTYALPLVSAALFAVHPVHSTVVAYLSSRADSLMSLFLLIAVIFYLKNLAKERLVLHGIVILSYIFSLLSKEYAIILPALLLVYHRAFKKPMRWRCFLPVIFLSGAYIALRMSVLHFGLPSTETSATTALARLPGFFVAFTNYLRMLLLPYDLHMWYMIKVFPLSDLRAITGIFLFAGSLWYALLRWNSDRIYVFGILWFIVALLPVSNIYPPLNAYMAEHWLYLPSIGFFIIIAHFSTSWLKEKTGSYMCYSLTALLVLFYTVIAIKQNDRWLDKSVFYQHALQFSPNSSILQGNLAKTFIEEGRIEEAVGLTRRAIASNPRNENAFNTLGAALGKLGKRKEAIEAFNKSIELDPKNAEAYRNLGYIYYEAGDRDKAELYYSKALEIHPGLVAALNGLGLVYATYDSKKAVAYFEKARQTNPNDPYAYNNIGMLLGGEGKDRESIGYFKKALELDPSYAAAHYNMALAYYNTGEYDLAAKHCDEGMRLGHKMPPGFREDIAARQAK